MPLSNTEYSDPRSSFIWAYDAVHGHIDVRDSMSHGISNTIVKLLRTPIMQRLQRIKQLGFAYQSYPAGNHSRHAHALGTMHMMRLLLKRLYEVGGLSGKLFTELHSAYPDHFAGNINQDYDILTQHMLVAGLLQDVGELPFSKSTRHILKPSSELKKSVENSVGYNVSSWDDEFFFTIACIYSERIFPLLNELNLPFLVFLITGDLHHNGKTHRSLLQLHQMMDGTIDADRLDYVFRDAHHTIGVLGTPSAVVESLSYYDFFGPVFSDPEPVSHFLATRAHLYSSVYFDTANRFYALLLVNFLNGVTRKKDCASEFFGHISGAELAIEDFLELDDVSLFSRINSFASGTTKRRLDDKTRHALEILVSGGEEYKCVWLPPHEILKQVENTTLPSDFFFDTFIYHNRPLYNAGSIRIKSERFQQYGETLPLEECGGPFSSMFRSDWSILPMPGSILMFIPVNAKSGSWKMFDRALKGGWLYQKLLEDDPLITVDFPTDTRGMEGFVSPAIFVSFCWADIDYVRKIANILHDNRREYYLYIDTFQGIGKTASMNSIEAAEAAEAVIILTSLNYATRYREAPDGYVAKEIFTISRRLSFNPTFRYRKSGFWVLKIGRFCSRLVW